MSDSVLDVRGWSCRCKISLLAKLLHYHAQVLLIEMALLPVKRSVQALYVFKLGCDTDGVRALLSPENGYKVFGCW